MSNTFKMIPEEDEPISRRVIRWIGKQLLKLIKWVARIMNSLITVPACNLYAKTRLAWILPIVALAALGYLAAYCAMTQWWVKQQVVTVAPWSFVRTAFAKEDSGLPKSTQDKIRAAFGVHADTFLKIATAESGQQAGNKGYNCIYGGKSMACKPEDRAKAWSVDCGLMMINVRGSMCPPELFDIDVNIKAAQGKFERQSFNAWSVCKTKVKCK